jgi:hypothetical protein
MRPLGGTVTSDPTRAASAGYMQDGAAVRSPPLGSLVPSRKQPDPLVNPRLLHADVSKDGVSLTLDLSWTGSCS